MPYVTHRCLFKTRIEKATAIRSMLMALERKRGLTLTQWQQLCGLRPATMGPVAALPRRAPYDIGGIF